MTGLPVPQIGLGLALVVLIDATVVRMLLVPATTARCSAGVPRGKPIRHR
jgi:uncharacterized membrane protein YdfJ with MMPL/SSD domain